MNLRRRLSRIEAKLKELREQKSSYQPIPREVHEQMEKDYLDGKGPLPPDHPCPPWQDPVKWAVRMRLARWMLQRRAGTIGPDELLPGMTAEEHAIFTASWNRTARRQ